MNYAALRKGDLVNVRWQRWYTKPEVGRVIGIRNRQGSRMMVTVALPGGRVLGEDEGWNRGVPSKWHHLPAYSFFEGDPRIEKIPTFPYLFKRKK